MRLITWNCQGAFRNKYTAIARLAPDVAVIQECEQPERLKWQGEASPPTAQLWFGEKPTRGLGIFSWGGCRLEPGPPPDAPQTDDLRLLQSASPARYCQPVRVTTPQGAGFHLLAIWAMAHRHPRFSYIAQVNFGLMTYEGFIRQAPTVVLGDFNSNQRSDRIQHLGYHGLVVRSLADLELISAYHFFYREKHGGETIPTFYHGRRRQRPFHIDYIFVPRTWLPRLRQVSIGRPQDWLTLSDHCPLLAEVTG